MARSVTNVFKGGFRTKHVARLAVVSLPMLLQGYTSFFDSHTAELAAPVHSIKCSPR